MPTPDRWLVLSVASGPDDPLRDLIGEGLLALGGLSVLEDDRSLTTYLPPPEHDLHTFEENARRFLEEWISDSLPEISLAWQRNEDWEREWRRGLKPRKVSPRFVIRPSWTEWDAAPDEVVVQIDPEMAFGTGEHPTTRGCLRLLDGLMIEGARVCDIGSGSGILSIAAALAGADEVVAVEYDTDANLNARDNIERNGVADRITLVESLADPVLIAELGKFDIVVANILSGVIRPLFPSLRVATRDEGFLIVSGILQEESEAVLKDARSAGLQVVEEDREEEWWSAALRPD